MSDLNTLADRREELREAECATAPELAGTLFALRVGVPQDRPYVTRSWAQCAAQTALGRALGSMMKGEHSRLIWAWLEHAATVVRVASDPNAPDVIIGFAVATPSRSLVHYVHVRRDFRELGIAKALLGDALGVPTEFTHRIADGSFYRGDHLGDALGVPTGWTYNPYPFLRGPRD